MLLTLTFLRHLQVRSKDATSTYFWIVPERLGQIPIEVNAVSGAAGDAVRRLLLVEVNNCQNYSATFLFE